MSILRREALRENASRCSHPLDHPHELSVQRRVPSHGLVDPAGLTLKSRSRCRRRSPRAQAGFVQATEVATVERENSTADRCGVSQDFGVFDPLVCLARVAAGQHVMPQRPHGASTTGCGKFSFEYERLHSRPLSCPSSARSISSGAGRHKPRRPPGRRR